MVGRQHARRTGITVRLAVSVAKGAEYETPHVLEIDLSTNRRDFLAALTVTGVGALAPGMPGVREALAHAAAITSGAQPERFEVFTPAEGADIRAIAARIVPTTNTPGATEAGVVYFIDKAFAGFAKDGLAEFRVELKGLLPLAQARRPGAASFAALAAADQDAVVREIEEKPFFGWIRSLVMMGMFADPKYGGNRDGIGWKLIGFENAMTHAAPFGYYDAEYAKGAR